MMPMAGSSVAVALCLGPMLVAAAYDLISFRIPNVLPLASTLFFPLAVLAGGATDGTLAGHLIGGACGLAIGITAFACGALGGGDAKLFAALALWGGIGQLLPLLVVISVQGGLLTVFLVMARNWNLGLVATRLGLALPIFERTAPIPYGVAIAGGALWLVGQPNWL